MKLFLFKQNGHNNRPVVPGCAGCAMVHPDFGRSVNPISTRGDRLCLLITTGTPGFSDLPTALNKGSTEHDRLLIKSRPSHIFPLFSPKYETISESWPVQILVSVLPE